MSSERTVSGLFCFGDSLAGRFGELAGLRRISLQTYAGVEGSLCKFRCANPLGEISGTRAVRDSNERCDVSADVFVAQRVLFHASIAGKLP